MMASSGLFLLCFSIEEPIVLISRLVLSRFTLSSRLALLHRV